ncbi:rod shape-determining protein [Candidatus Campbellbacteria bacterium RIFCSPLOWO2_02_FULL_35_11]|uniref:Cell shape-determining protein MreB n=2 Tax=Candidatus Campbelliibacteriota TaxID=1752727 RepID=A0A1F5ELA0_9BACT|nr:MAG: rod shape-determining protein [Candidatus Campbellbacteria bacterium RIFCSPHIGHO2_12_FULL_35_10]OGD70425.1 MAG: rod shape-determining protein [Candidatus Campbellbacteria bacterium RIFCSPLOWO2_02_FULL_35_11]
MRKKFDGWFSNDVGIDLGTANTLVYRRGKGIVISEPSVVAINQKTGRVVAIGEQAKKMLGRTPAHIIAVKPLVDGVISDFEVTEEMIAYLINKAQKDSNKMIGPRVLVGVPSGITNVETRAVRDAARNAGAREVHIIEEPVAAAIGHRLPVKDPVGSVIVDIGGGTTDIAVISLGGIVNSKNLRIAGDKFNQDIISYMRDEYKMLIGEKTAENLKIAIGSLIPQKQKEKYLARGRDLVTGLPKEITVTDEDIRKAIGLSIDIILDAVKEVLETTPPEIVSDIIHRGVFLAGGGALLKGFDQLLSEYIEVPVYIVDDPLTAVARGTGIVLEDLDNYREMLIQNDDELPLRN